MVSRTVRGSVLFRLVLFLPVAEALAFRALDLPSNVVVMACHHIFDLVGLDCPWGFTPLGLLLFTPISTQYSV